MLKKIITKIPWYLGRKNGKNYSHLEEWKNVNLSKEYIKEPFLSSTPIKPIKESGEIGISTKPAEPVYSRVKYESTASMLGYDDFDCGSSYDSGCDSGCGCDCGGDL